VKKLTARQAEVLLFLRRYRQALGYSPSIREISVEFGIALRAVSDHLQALERKGAIRRTNGVARSIVIETGGRE